MRFLVEAYDFSVGMTVVKTCHSEQSEESHKVGTRTYEGTKEKR